MMSKIHDCPCDPCYNRRKCGREALECKAVKQYYTAGWYQPEFIGLKLKRMKGYDKGHYVV